VSDFRKLHYVCKLRRNAWRKTKDLLQIQRKKLRKIIKYAYENVEYYHRKFDSVGLKPDDIRIIEDLKKLPATTKRELLANFPEKVTAMNIDLKKCVSYATSGSTGIPLVVFVDPKGNDYRAALFARPFFEGGLRLRDKMMFVQDARRIPKDSYSFQKMGILRRRYFAASNSVEKDFLKIVEYDPDVIYSYSSYLFLLAQAIREAETKYVSPRLVFGTSEILSKQARGFINSVLGTEMFDLYGCVETERLAWECKEHTGYHMDIDSAVIEFVEDNEIVSPGEEGRIVVTCLYNYAMPLIRYDLGDIGVPCHDKCACGRGLPLMKTILGRQDDFIVCPDGRMVIPINFEHIFRPIQGIAQYKVIQQSRSKLNVLVVKDRNFSDETLERIVEEVGKVVGENMSIAPRVVEKIEKEKSGKLRSVVSKVHGGRAFSQGS